MLLHLPRVVLVGRAPRHRLARHDGEAFRAHLKVHTGIAAAIGGLPERSSRFGLGYASRAPPVHDDLDLVLRVQRRLQAEHGLAALQRSGDTMQRLRPAASIALRSQRNLDALVARDHADTEIHR
jgi:hypothetical protein